MADRIIRTRRRSRCAGVRRSRQRQALLSRLRRSAPLYAGGRVACADEEEITLADIRGSYYYGTGRRKTAVARVRLYANGDGTIIVNGKDSNQYFGREAL